ncbi:MAG TPA: RsmE family RNA methyltransferase [Thermoanaerobaculia bacterium]
MDLSEPGARLIVDRLPAAGAACRITGEEVAHAHARRLASGDAIVLVDGSGREAVGRLTRRQRRELEVFVESIRVASVQAHAPISLGVAAIRGERLGWVAEKATELGAARLTLLTSERTQSFRASQRLVPRLERVVREAAKQSERARWPAIVGPVALSEIFRSESSKNRLMLDPSGEVFPSLLRAESTALLVGPEGGWSDRERDGAIASGWRIVSLAAGKLRAETAAVAALILAQAALARKT